jgi:uncharacterized delta-60 repeat protein
MNRHHALRHIRRIAIATAVAAMSFVTSSPSAHAAMADGSLDPSFGTGGIVTTDITGRADHANAVAVQADRKIVTVGFGSSATDKDFALSRSLPDGTADGVSSINFGLGSNEEANAVVIQPDGKILSAGYANFGTTFDDFAIVRYNSDLTVDTSFGAGGKVRDTVSVFNDAVTALVLQPDGKLVAAGYSSGDTFYDFAVVRYNSDGTRDNTFGSGGMTTTSFGVDSDVKAVVLQPDGKIVVTGNTIDRPGDDDIAIVRFNANGSLDTSFGTNGKITASLSPSAFTASDLVILPDGKLVVAGESAGRVTVVRYNADGSLDTSFGTNGTATTSVGSPSFVRALVLQPDGKLVTGEIVRVGLTYEFGLERFNVNGSLDTSFGSGGRTKTAIASPSFAWLEALALQPDGDIVAAGWVRNGSQDDFVLARYDVTYPGLVTGSPTRLLDTRSTGKPTFDSVMHVESGAPAGTGSMLVNLTATGAEQAGYLTADACTTLDPDGQSNLNYQPGNDIANTSVVSLDPDGSFCIYTSASVDVIVDRQGTYLPDGNKLTTLNPKRILDTRNSVKAPNNSITKVATGAPAGTSSVLVNLTVTGAEAAGYITADKCSVLTPGLQTKSNANFQPGNDIANTSVVNIDPDGSFCIYTDQTTHLLADLQGTYQAATGKNLIKPPARRLIDTRNTTKPAANAITRVQTNAPAGITAVLVNLTVTGAEAAGYITADKCSALVPGPQTNSNANFRVGADIANTAVINVDPDGSFCIYTNQATHLLADLQGIY